MLDWYGLMKRSGQLKNRAQQLEDTGQILRSRLNFQGTTLGFSTERQDYLWWLMVSTDVNANRLLLAVLDEEKWRDDIPRLTRGTLGRQQFGHWNTTVANAWGIVAMDKYSARFESDPVTGEVQANLAMQKSGLDWGKQPSGGSIDFNWPDRQERLSVDQIGSGKPWVSVQSRAAIPLKEALSSGYKIVRTVIPVEVKTAGELHRGDTVRIRLEIEAQADMSWVVVDDPVPGGAAILGSGLGTDSRILSAGEAKPGFVWPAFEERGFDAFHAYYRFVPKGSFVVEYTVRLNNPGRFELPPTRVEAMYAPEMFGELPNVAVVVGP